MSMAYLPTDTVEFVSSPDLAQLGFTPKDAVETERLRWAIYRAVDFDELDYSEHPDGVGETSVFGPYIRPGETLTEAVVSSITEEAASLDGTDLWLKRLRSNEAARVTAARLRRRFDRQFEIWVSGVNVLVRLRDR